MLGALIRSWRRRGASAAPEPAAPASLDAVGQLFDDRKFDEVIALSRAWLIEHPEDARALSLLAGTLSEADRPQEACETVERALLKNPREAQQVCAAGEIHRRAGRHARALELAVLACQLDPGNVAHWLLKARILEHLGRNLESHKAYGRAVALAPQDRNLHSSHLFLLNRSAILSPKQTLAEARRWAASHADPFTPAAPAHANDRDPDRMLRIGYVSADFNHHVVTFFMEPVLEAHDRRRFGITCYYSGTRSDEFTERLKALVPDWRDISAMGDDDVAALIRRDGIDILVDLSGHSLGNRLPVFARKPAPLQLCWLGYVGTTGMKAMDGFIGDPRADPAGESEGEFCERILRLPVTSWCFRRPDIAPPVAELPCRQNGFVTFGSFSNFFRLNDETFESWADILKQVPRSRLRVVGAPPGEALDRITIIMDKAGIDATRLDFIRKVGYREYFQLLSATDIALGSFPYNGATTICEALWMGVPVVSRVGDRHASRAGSSVLGAVGLERLVASTPAGYAAIAVGLAGDTEALATLRAGMRERMLASALMDAKAFVAGLELGYRRIWSEWCAGRG